MAASIETVRVEAVDKRKQLATEIVRSRKRKLAELYTLSSLSKIWTVLDDDPLTTTKDSVRAFVESHDIESEFDPAELPLLQFDSGDATGGSPSAQELDSTEKSTGVTTAAAETAGSHNTPKEPEIIVGKSTVPTDTKQIIEPAPVPKVAPVVKQQEQSILPPPPPPPPQIVIPSKTIASSVINSEEAIKKSFKKHKKDHPLELFDPVNKDNINTLILVLKNYLPAKVAEVTPLAELYYLAQTLPLVKLMPTTHKVVTSSMYETALTEGKINVVHSRIEELKRQGKWSLKQPQRFVDPLLNSKKRSHWENLLSEMSWMSVDFKEERKFKVATCATIAKSIQDYWKFGKVCCIKTRPIVHITTDEEDEVKLEDFINIEESKEAESDSMDVDDTDNSRLLERPQPSDEITPAELPESTLEEYNKYLETEEPNPFKLQVDTNDFKNSDKILFDGIPTFGTFEKFNDCYDRAPLIPVSKALLPQEDETWFNCYLQQTEDNTNSVPDQQKGLFGFSSRNRLSTIIKPPQPPSLRYLNLRTPTIWLPEDDQNLIEYVNQFSFNWGIVSAHLSKRPTRSYQSNIERRTPWQCFERYIQLNDAFQIGDMRGHNYMAATKWLEHAHHIQATTKRRISPLGVGVESIQRGHKRLRWASMFEAIRKCMRKRESVTRPNSNHQRKNIDEKKLVAPTPAELSKLKFERDKAIQEAYIPNQQRRVVAGNDNKAAAAHPVQQTGQQAVQRVNNTQIQARPAQAQVQQSQQVQQQRPNSVPAQSIAKQQQNGATQVPGLKNVSGTSYTPEQIQQIIQMRQRKLANGVAQGSPSPNGAQAQLVNIQRSNSNPTQVAKSAASLSNTVKTVPVSRQQAFVPAHVSAIISQIQAQHPNLSKQEVTNMAAQYLANLQAKQNARAAAAAATAVNTTTTSTTPASNTNNTNNSAKFNTSGLAGQRSSQHGSPAAQNKSISVPTPQQILQQQQQRLAASASNNGTSHLANGGSEVSSTISSTKLTPEQKAQLDMLKVLHAEQQQKRQQASIDNGSTTNANPKGNDAGLSG